jgi:hypothetical protein
MKTFRVGITEEVIFDYWLTVEAEDVNAAEAAAINQVINEGFYMKRNEEITERYVNLIEEVNEE